MIANNAWNAEKYSTLTRMWSEGASGELIAAEIGKTRNAILGKVAALGLQRYKSGTTTKARSPKPPSKLHKVVSKPSVPPRVRPVWTPPPDAVAPLELSPEEAKSTWVPFLECGDTQCKWPVTTGPTMCCGDQIMEPRPYCEKHARIAYREYEDRSNEPKFRRHKLF